MKIYFNAGGREELKRILKKLEGTFIEKKDESVLITNPSIIDFLILHLQTNDIVSVLESIDIIDVYTSEYLKQMMSKHKTLKNYLSSKLKNKTIYDYKTLGEDKKMIYFKKVYKFFDGEDRKEYFDRSIFEEKILYDVEFFLEIYKKIQEVLRNYFNGYLPSCLGDPKFINQLGTITEINNWAQKTVEEYNDIDTEVGDYIENCITDTYEAEQYKNTISKMEEIFGLSIDIEKLDEKRNELETAKEEISYYDIEFGSGKGIHDMEKAEINDLFDTLKE